LDRIGLFDPNTVSFEDWDFYLRFALEYRIGTILEPLVRFRIHKAHTTMDEFTHGRINTAMKHLAMLDSRNNFPFRNRVRHNFYTHLANAYYIDMQLTMFRTYALKAIKLNPLILFRSRLGLHFLLSLMSPRVNQKIRQLKGLQFRKAHLYPERIIPEETFGGPLASHLKRYDFIKLFCVNKMVLDAACGVGYGAHYLAKNAKEVIGVDNCEEAIAYAKEHYKKVNIQFKVMDVCNLEFPDRYFDMVCSFETLEHLDDLEKFISEVERVLKEDGIFVVSTPHVKKSTRNPKNPYHKAEFSPKEFEGLLKKHFMTVEILGQRRLQSNFHYYLQKIDIFHLRAILSAFIRRKICHAVATRSWDEADLSDFVISKEGIRRATELIGVCRLPVK
jgi:2-polyprenyl-3-methyl-5-hydroxy-6-metoxy-1,4-benzoquinol methylase